LSHTKTHWTQKILPISQKYYWFAVTSIDQLWRGRKCVISLTSVNTSKKIGGGKNRF